VKLFETCRYFKERMMRHDLVGRRQFIQRSAMLLGTSTIFPKVFGQTTLMVRPEWQAFKTTPRYDSFLRAVKLMKANTQATDPNSWSYWTNIHLNRCPHSIPYFFAWHRGYIYYFERRLRAVCGDPQLVLPYWDYYTNPTLPAEFTNPYGDNPLYESRVNNNVRQALSMAPFSSSLTNFPTNSPNAFEPSFESAPHNLVHNIIGGVMSDMLSPTDPIFWLHHANVDRYWVAWVLAGSGRKMPALSSGYWSGSHIYTSTLTMPRSYTYSTRTTLGYRYQNESFPTGLPLARSALSTPDLVQAAPNEPARMQPPLGSFRIAPTRETSEQTFSISGALDVHLDERSIGVQLPLGSESMRALAQIGTGATATLRASPKRYRSVQVVLDNVMITEAAKRGGYYYRVDLNLPPDAFGRSQAIPIGTVGAFEISGAAHHGSPVRLRYRIRRAVFAGVASRIGLLSVSFVRVDGDQSPTGQVIGLGEVRLELSTEDNDA
jgi:tyrosinase